MMKIIEVEDVRLDFTSNGFTLTTSLGIETTLVIIMSNRNMKQLHYAFGVRLAELEKGAKDEKNPSNDGD